MRILSPSIHKFDDELIQTSAERLDMSSSTCLGRSPQDLVLPLCGAAVLQRNTSAAVLQCGCAAVGRKQG